MMRRDTPGKVWRDATAEFELAVPAELDSRYGAALDLLARKVAPHLRDCNGGIWEPRGGDDARHRLSLAWLGRLLVAECEQARPPQHPTPPKPAPRMAPAKRHKVVKVIRSAAELLKSGDAEIFLASLAAHRYVVPAPGAYPPVESPRTETLRAWVKRQRRLHLDNLIADALLAIADDMDARKKPRGRHEQPETKLAAALVTWLRVATGAPWHYQADDWIVPKDRRPFYGVATAFVRAAGWSMTEPVMKSRLEARKRA